jgi:phage tail-like protein
MSQQSSYLHYLPHALWAHDNDPQQFLGDMLRIFEKILTGIPDGVRIGDDEKSYRPLEEVIDHLPQYFNPWRTPDVALPVEGLPDENLPKQSFLSWLASWVALNLRDEWSEYQRRKITAEIVSVYRLRGLEQGLHAYLDIYAQTKARPRIAIDDGKAVLRVRFLEDGTARLTTIAHSQVITFPAAAGRPASHTPILIHAAAIAVDSHNDYLVIDQGTDVASDLPALQRPALWKISSTGDVRYATGALPAPLPQPLHTDAFFRDATAAAVDNLDRCSVINVGEPTAENSQRARLWRFTPPTYTSATVIDQTTTPKLPVVRPVDMVLDTQQRFVILDRGTHLRADPPTGFPAAPRIVVVSEGPLAVEPLHPLPEIVEPTALVQAPDRTFIVADARQLSSSEPANLWRVDPANNWTATPLLNDVPPSDNPLIFITGMVFTSPTSLLVCDTGLRWGTHQHPSNRSMAEPAALFRLDLSQSPPQIIRVTKENILVNPTKMVMDRQGQIIISERGESLRQTLKRNWRARTNEFGVVVHFSQQRPTTDDQRNQTRRGIAAVVEEQKPSHTSWWLKSE